jgi:uncharacterized protein
MSRAFLNADWRWLAMLNYEADPALLEPYVPAGTVLDSWNGVFYLSVVGFLFEHTRVLGIGIPGHRNFEEVNLRLYVRRSGRRGVVFVKELVPRRAVAAVARWLYNENYQALPMSHRLEGSPPRYVEYGWRFRGSWNHLRLESTGEAEAARLGSLEEFITEHYWGYTKQKDGGCTEYRVEHPPWRLWQVAHAELAGDAAELFGSEFARVLGRAPKSAFLAEGSEVAVYRGVRLEAGRPPTYAAALPRWPRR